MPDREDRIDDRLAVAIALQFENVNLDTATRERMRERVLSASGLQVRRHDAREWQPLLPGITVNTLRRDVPVGQIKRQWNAQAWQCGPAARI